MAISFPITLPTSVKTAATVRWRAEAAVGLAESNFTFQGQAQVHQGQRWGAVVSLPPMPSRADAEEWVAALTSLNGQEGTFLFGPTAYTTARGTAGGTPLVNGASQTGQDLITDGWSASATFLKGDMFQLGTGSTATLHKMLIDGTADGGGNLTLTIWPSLRSSPANNAALTISSPVGVFRLADPFTEWDVDEAKTYGIAFAAIEAL